MTVPIVSPPSSRCHRRAERMRQLRMARRRVGRARSARQPRRAFLCGFQIGACGSFLPGAVCVKKLCVLKNSTGGLCPRPRCSDLKKHIFLTLEPCPPGCLCRASRGLCQLLGGGVTDRALSGEFLDRPEGLASEVERPFTLRLRGLTRRCLRRSASPRSMRPCTPGRGALR